MEKYNANLALMVQPWLKISEKEETNKERLWRLGLT